MVEAMHVVAIEHPVPRRAGQAWLDDDWVRARAQGVGVTFHELRARLRVLDGWPGVLATHAGARPAHTMAEALRREGIEAWVLPSDRVEPRARVRQFSLHDAVLRGEADGGAFEIPTADVSMLAHGVQMGEDVDVILTGPGLSPLARTGLWVSPSLGRTRPERRSRATREPFVELHARGCPILSFRASALRYAALGDGVLQPTRVANFQRVVQTLRMACPHASYDARLCGRMEQIRVLGPLLRPEKHLALALALVAGSRPERSPYR